MSIREETCPPTFKTLKKKLKLKIIIINELNNFCSMLPKKLIKEIVYFSLSTWLAQ